MLRHRNVRSKHWASFNVGMIIETPITMPRNSNVRNDLTFYDQQAPHWWDEAATVYPLQRLNPLRFQYFDRFVPDWSGLQVLDVGCGGGYTCEFLAQRGAKVWGVDQSAACIEAAQAHAAQGFLSIDYHHGMGEQLPYGDRTFDVVICVDVLEHVANPARTLAEIHRVLKPGGLFCFDTLNRTWQSRLVMIWLLEDLLQEIPQGIHDWRKFITPQELTVLLQQHCFSSITINGFNLFGSTLLEKIAALRYYWQTGDFRIRFDTDTSIMYIGIAIKG